MRSLIIIYECRLDPEYENVYAMSNNYNNEMVVGINYSLISGWAQDSQLPFCSQFEPPGGRGDAWEEIRFRKEFPDGPRKEANYSHKIRLQNGTLVERWEVKEDGIPLFTNITPYSEYSPSTGILHQK